MSRNDNTLVVSGSAMMQVPGSWVRVPRSRFPALSSLQRRAALLLQRAGSASDLDRAVAEFEQGRFGASVAAFDELARLMPDRAPHLWQRGIALYYAGRYADCRRQFESHRTVNPDDVENAAWHFLCVAREQNHRARTGGPAAGRARFARTDAPGVSDVPGRA